MLMNASFPEVASMLPVSSSRRISWADCNSRRSNLRNTFGIPMGQVSQAPTRHQRMRTSLARSSSEAAVSLHTPDLSHRHHPSAIVGNNGDLGVSVSVSASRSVPLTGHASDLASSSTNGAESVHQALHTLSQLAASLQAAPTTGQSAHQPSQHQSYETVMQLLQAIPQCPDAYQPPSNFPVVLMTLYQVHDLLTSTPTPPLLLPASTPSNNSNEHTSYPWSELLQTGLSLYALKAPWHVGSFTNSSLDTLLEQCVSKDAQGFAVTLWKRVTAAVPQYRSLQELRSISSLCETLLSSAAPQDPFIKAMGPTAVGAREACHALLCNTVHCSLHSTARLLPTSPAPHLASRELIDAIRAFNWRLRSAPTPAFTPRPAFTAGVRSSTSLAPLQPFVPSRSWVSAVLSAALNTREVLQPQQVSHLLSDLQELSSRGQSSQHSSSPVTMLGASRVLSTVKAASTAWVGVLDPSGHVAVQDAVVRHREVWEPQEMAALLLTLCGRGGTPPDSELCGVIGDTLNALPGLGASREINALFQNIARGAQHPPDDGLLDGGDTEAPSSSYSSSNSSSSSSNASGRDTSSGSSSSSGMGSNISLLCALLHDAAHLVGRGHYLTPSHRSLINTTFNKLIYLMGTESPSCAQFRPAPPDASAPHQTSPSLWQNCSFLFDQYPKLLDSGTTLGMPASLLYHDTYLKQLQRYITTAPSQELVLRGPEGLTRALKAASLPGSIHDLAWAHDFETACTTLIDVQLTVGFTHPLRWTPLFNATLESLPEVPMPRLAAAARCLCVRFCKMESHADHMWALLPVLGRLEHTVESASSSSIAAASLSQIPMAHSQTSQSQVHMHAGGSIGSNGRFQFATSTGTPHSNPTWQPRMTSGVAPASGSSGAAAAATAALEEQLRKYAISGVEYESWTQSVGKHLASALAHMSTAGRARHYRNLRFSWNQVSSLSTVDFSDL